MMARVDMSERLCPPMDAFTGRGHWFDPSTAHQKPNIYAILPREVRQKYGIIP